jgi:hypothetical protein
MAEEERKGHLKVTVDVELNEALMDVMEESIAKMPERMVKRFQKSEKK